MKKTLFLLFALFAFAAVNAQTKLRGDTLIWRPDYQLVKEDFKAKVKKGAAGLTYSGIYLYTKEVNGQMIFVVEAIMDKKKSFIIDDSKYVLNHEQKHFDITEIFSRKLRQKIAVTDLMKVKDIRGKVNQLYTEVMEACMREQQKYDKETENGMNMVKQDFWNDKIAKELAALEQYAATEVNVVGK